jgi:putative component of toxin-antitoxin plasmid stabilization module
MNKIRVIITAEYLDWYGSQTDKIRVQINNRLDRILEHGHYGQVKRLSFLLNELKTKSYF